MKISLNDFPLLLFVLPLGVVQRTLEAFFFGRLHKDQLRFEVPRRVKAPLPLRQAGYHPNGLCTDFVKHDMLIQQIADRYHLRLKTV